MSSVHRPGRGSGYGPLILAALVGASFGHSIGTSIQDPLMHRFVECCMHVPLLWLPVASLPLLGLASGAGAGSYVALRLTGQERARTTAIALGCLSAPVFFGAASAAWLWIGNSFVAGLFIFAVFIVAIVFARRSSL